MTSTEQATRTPGSWFTTDCAIYQIDELGNPGRLLAWVNDRRVAASMVETHNSMLAALQKMTDGITGKTGPLGDEEYDEFIEPIIEQAKAAILKATGGAS